MRIPTSSSRVAAGVPLVASVALVLAACGGGGSSAVAQQQPVAPAAAPAAPAAAPAAPAANAAAAPAAAAHAAAPAAKVAATPVKSTGAKAAKPIKAAALASRAAGGGAEKSSESDAQQATNTAIYNEKNGATDVGVTKDAIRLGSVNMHGMPLGNIFVGPQVRAMAATATAVNDRGGILGRRMLIEDCDDGPGEVSRAKACLKKLVQDHVFSLVSAIDWATASMHDDLKQYHLPYVGAWAYSQTEWQDPFMFPTHMSMIHEAMAGAHWAVNVIKPKTYGLICLTSPEMQLACNQVVKIIDASGAKMVKRADVSISETSMSAYVLAMRAANPDHIIHYVINPATIAKFMVEAAQQGYWPPKGISGNHLTGEVIGSLLGSYPAGRYWTNTTYKIWGAEYMAVMNKYARGNKGANHHITQAGYTALNIFAQAAKQVGPNLTRDRLMAALQNGKVWNSDASMDQKWSWQPAERFGTNWNHDYGQGREFMYLYDNPNTLANPDGSANGFVPDKDQFVIYTDH